MAEKRSYYEVKINNIPHVLLLSSSDAERYGDAATKVDKPKAAEPVKGRGRGRKPIDPVKSTNGEDDESTSGEDDDLELHE